MSNLPQGAGRLHIPGWRGPQRAKNILRKPCKPSTGRPVHSHAACLEAGLGPWISKGGPGIRPLSLETEPLLCMQKELLRRLSLLETLARIIDS